MNDMPPEAVSIGTPARGDSAEAAFCEERRRHWDRVARETNHRQTWSRAYHRRLEHVYDWLIPPGLKVIELGCGTGELLASTHPAVGVGVDFAPAMIDAARARYPALSFVCADAHDVEVDDRFDVVILSDLVNDVWDVERVFVQASRLLAPGGRIALNFYSRLWERPLKLAGAIGLSNPTLEQSWLTRYDVQNLLDLADCEIVRHWTEVLCPLPVPGLEPLCNRVLVKSWPFSAGALTNFLVARVRPAPMVAATQHAVSVVIPARNEAGHIEAIFERLPTFGSSLEMIFVEGHSSDDTRGEIERAMARHPDRCCLLLKQPGRGKGDAVRVGFARATGEVLMILDADLTVAPEDLPRFYHALVSGKGDVVNGVRLVYPMEERAMRFFNLLANKFFGWLFSWLLGQRVKDTLCGTKVLWKRDYALIAATRSYFGDFDPFGDFELLFGAAKLTRKIVEMPVRYRDRVYGETNIRRWRDGWLLLRMAAIAARRLKWV